jgi:hypothetical protein
MNSWFAFKAPPISGHPFERDFGAGSYTSACLVRPSCVRLWPRRAERLLPQRGRRDRAPVQTKADSVGRGGRSPEGKMLVANRIKVETDAPGGLGVAVIKDSSAAPLHGLVASVTPGATIKTDGCPSLRPRPRRPAKPISLASWRPCRSALDPPCLLQGQTWTLGAYHGLRRELKLTQ